MSLYSVLRTFRHTGWLKKVRCFIIAVGLHVYSFVYNAANLNIKKVVVKILQGSVVT